MSGEFVTVLPSAGRLMSSLRDIGYDLPSAIADLVDNAIDARAETIEIEVCADGAESWVRVCDDGDGMNAARLDEAMRYGADAAYTSDSLGHFGLGLKTASLSQCRRLTVASRPRGTARMAVRRWDLDRVVARNAWELERLSTRDTPDHVREPIEDNGHGTTVLWEVLDRVLPRRPTAGMSARVLRTATEEIRSHVAMIFHRFLDGEADDGRRVRVYINGEEIQAWDPFARKERNTRSLPEQTLAYDDGEGGSVSVGVRPFVLPAQHDFSSPEAHREAGGPRRWNRHQGFYIYRRQRLIQPGGWNRLRTLDEHAKLARIAIDLPERHEDRFAVDVAKMRVTLPEDLRPGLRAIASTAVAVAQERYREHASQLGAPLEEALEKPIGAEAISISRDWPAIMATVSEVLAQDPELRDTLLLRLANADADEIATIRDGVG